MKTKIYYKAFAVHPETKGLHSVYYGNRFIFKDSERPAYTIGQENRKDKNTSGFFAITTQEAAAIWADFHIKYRAEFEIRRVKLSGRIRETAGLIPERYGKVIIASRMTIVKERKR